MLRLTIPSPRLLKLVGWTSSAYAAVQGLRLFTNVILARLLSPELFGIMLLINTLRTAVDLLADVGIGQNIVTSKSAEDPDFYNTAWTLKAIRGLVLCLVCSAVAIPLSIFYKMPILATALPVASLYFVFTGLGSTARFMLQKRLQVRRLSFFEVLIAAASAVIHIVFALISPTIWALVLAGVASSALAMVGSYFLAPDIKHKVRISRQYTKEVFSFGKWIFIATLMYFLAMNFDRLYLGMTISLALLGTYGVARSLTDIMTVLSSRIGNMILFPVIAASDFSRAQMKAKLTKVRRTSLLVAATGVSFFAATSGNIVSLLYDERYQAATSMLPVLSLGAWFAILSTINGSVLLGLNRPIYGALANSAKLAWLITALPLAITGYGLAGAVCTLAVSETVRFVALWIGQRREGLSSLLQDSAMTVVMLGMVVVWKMLLRLLGLEDSLGGPLAIFGIDGLAAIQNTR